MDRSSASQLEPSNAVLMTLLTTVQRDLEEMKQDSHAIRKAIDDSLIGQGDSPGLIIQVDRLKQQMGMIKWLVGAIGGAVVVEGIHILVGFFNHA